MADVYEKDLAQKTSLTTSDYIRVVGSDNVSYKQLVSDVASKIIATYATNALGGKTQSIKSFADHWGTAIPYTGNIDELFESSIYTYNQQSNTGTFPTTNTYGTIVTLGGTSNNYATQIAKANASSDDSMYVRYRGAGAWSSWQRMPTRAEVDALTNAVGDVSFTVTTTSVNVGKSITIPNGYRGVMWTIDSATNKCGMSIVYSTSTGGVTLVPVLTASGLTISSSTNTISITSSGTTRIVFLNVFSKATV